MLPRGKAEYIPLYLLILRSNVHINIDINSSHQQGYITSIHGGDICPMDALWGPQSLAALYCIHRVMDINYQFKSINCIQDLEGQYSSYKLTTILHPTEHHIFCRHHKISTYSLDTFNLG